ncbi:MAG TPA: phosphatase domain-containing protein [Chryseosolibacter sp.]|nr:phosphatase domain-containing protein [Chryseosolibacter sp.]
MAKKFPILLSFYGLSHQGVTLVFGQLTFTGIKDLSFQAYSRRKTFRTLFRLYQTRPYSNQELVLVFDRMEVRTSTNSYGGFYQKTPHDLSGCILQKVVLPGGEEVKVMADLYATVISPINTASIVISDIDDTLVHSFIYKKIRKFRTLMFTTMEKRQAVVNMQQLIRNFTDSGATPVYLSNSEQNLYPMIYRFLTHNKFPAGPLFLKQLRSLWDVIWNIKFPVRNIHKTQVLEELLTLFPDKKFVLMGDNTQHDLPIYLTVAEKYPENISYIIIRKVVDKTSDEDLVKKALTFKSPVRVYYSDNFPSSFEL